jgi:pteridine reductase
MSSLIGKVALVTGGARRVGRAVALALAEAGFDVAITFKDSTGAATELVAAVEAMGRRALAIRADLAGVDVVSKIYDEVINRFGRLDALINNASAFMPTPFNEVTPDAYNEMMTVNALVPFLLMQKFQPLLQAQYDPADPTTTGRIVNFIDIHVLGEPLKGFLAYNASKAALMEITSTAAVDLAPRITVNAVAPGVVAWAEFYTQAQRNEFMARVPLQWEGRPEDAAAAVLYLVRDAHYCTGQVIKVDGGRILT